MAFTATLATPVIASTTDATSYATASWTPTALRLILVWAAYGVGSGNAVSPTLSGNGLTWTEIDNGNSGQVGFAMFAALTGASPSAGALTASFGAVTQTYGHIHVVEVDGAMIGGTVAAAFAQTRGTNQSNQTTLSLSFLSTPRTDSRCFCGVSISVNEAITERANWTELGDAGSATPTRRTETQWRSDASEIQTTATWAGTSTALRVVIAEVRAATENIASADTGSGAEAGTAPAASFTNTDTGSGAENGSSIGTSNADTSSGTDAQTAPAATLPGTDTSSGSDDGSTTAALATAETGAGADAHTPAAAALTSADTASGVETQSVVNSITGIDVGSGLEAGTIAATLSGTDTGSSIDTGTLAAALAASDIGSAIDAQAAAAAIAAAEQVVAVEAASIEATVEVPASNAASLPTITARRSSTSTVGGRTSTALASASRSSTSTVSDG